MFFESWADFLRIETDRSTSPRFCELLEFNVRNLRDKSVEAEQALVDGIRGQIEDRLAHGTATDDLQVRAAQAQEARDVKGRRAAYPWVTPVLGTGCLSIDDADLVSPIAYVPSRLGQIVGQDGDVLPDGDSAPELVERFAGQLLQHRVPGCRPTPAAGRLTPTTEEYLPKAARAALCAALMNRLLLGGAALLDAPPVDEFDFVRLHSDTSRGAELVREIAEPLDKALGSLVAELGEEKNQSFVLSFAQEVKAQVSAEGGRRVRRSDVVLMGEIAWHYMTRGTSEYAGWRELLLRVGVLSGEIRADHRLPFISNLGDQRGLVQWLVEGLSDTTRESRKRVNSTRWRFYATIADLITAQAELDRSTAGTAKGADFPPGVAYVTSFDLELELALLDRHSPFVMVVPFEVLASQGGTARATLVWLYTIVRPSEGHDADADLDLIQNPGRWDFVTSATFRGERAPARGLPVVVRLTGSPMVTAPAYGKLPDAPPAVRGNFRGVDTSTARVVGAVLVDEYVGLHHWSAEISADSDGEGALGLPKELVASRASVNELAKGGLSNLDSRFWLLLGVQISDDAIRNRVAAVVGARHLRSGWAAAHEPELAGVAINRRSAPRERDVFHWQGLDVVRGDCAEVQTDLQHHVEHLRDVLTYGAAHRASPDQCTLPLPQAAS